MGFFRTTGKIFGSIVNIRVDQWLGLDYIKYSLGQTKTLVKNLFTVKKAESYETFEQAMKHFNITEEDLKQKEKELTNLFVIYLLTAFIILLYTVYSFYSGFLISGIMSLCITLYPLSMAFRFHFWLFQIRHRKLGCTLKEWWYNT